LHRAQAVLSDGSQIAAGAPAVQARIRVLLAEVRQMQGAGLAEMLAECEAAAAVLEAEEDLDGLADALILVGKLRFVLGGALAGGEVLERAIACARQSGHHRARMRASTWLATTFYVLPIPADAAVARTEELLHDASGDTWAKHSSFCRSACCTPISAVPPTPARRSAAASPYSPASALNWPWPKAP
jgi:hypothetical protein